jgi:hypothetical protein
VARGDGRTGEVQGSGHRKFRVGPEGRGDHCRLNPEPGGPGLIGPPALCVDVPSPQIHAIGSYSPRRPRTRAGSSGCQFRSARAQLFRSTAQRLSGCGANRSTGFGHRSDSPLSDGLASPSAAPRRCDESLGAEMALLRLPRESRAGAARTARRLHRRGSARSPRRTNPGDSRTTRILNICRYVISYSRRNCGPRAYRSDGPGTGRAPDPRQSRKERSQPGREPQPWWPWPGRRQSEHPA